MARQRRHGVAAGACLGVAIGVGAVVLSTPGTSSALSATTTTTTTATPAATPAAEIPVAGTFSYHVFQNAQRPLVHGVVHAVRRIPGGTVVYYSLGFAPGSTPTFVGLFPAPSLDDYRLNDAKAVAIVDLAGLRYYQPMVAHGTCLCSRDYEFNAPAGTLTTGFAVLPELPAGLDTVSVDFGFGTQVEGVPVGTGPLTPVSTGAKTTAELGAGWPALPDEARIASVSDPERYVHSLVSTVANTERTVTTKERPGTVEVDLAADVLFAVDRSVLSPAARATMAKVATDIMRRGNGVVTVTGFTDATGDAAHNQTLSRARARSVLAGLMPAVATAGVTFTSVGKGESEPVADNGTPEGRRLNRRVTVRYQVGKAR